MSTARLATRPAAIADPGFEPGFRGYGPRGIARLPQSACSSPDSNRGLNLERAVSLSWLLHWSTVSVGRRDPEPNRATGIDRLRSSSPLGAPQSRHITMSRKWVDEDSNLGCVRPTHESSSTGPSTRSWLYVCTPNDERTTIASQLLVAVSGRASGNPWNTHRTMQVPDSSGSSLSPTRCVDSGCLPRCASH